MKGLKASALRAAMGMGAASMMLILPVGAALVGCEDSQFESGVRGTVQERLQKRGEEGKAAIGKLFSERDDRIRKQIEEIHLGSLEWDPEQQHPLVKWRSELNATDPVPKALAEHAPKYPGTELENAIPRYQTFFQSNDRYWRDVENASLDEYWGFLNGYLQANPDGPFSDDVIFDMVFVHARRQFELFKIKPENRVTSVFRFWQLAFELPSLPGEAFMPYIARLCEKDDDFRTFCRKIPFEFRHIAIMNPYYDVLIGKLEDMKKRFPDSPYMGAADYLVAQFKADQEKLAKEFEEYPILGESMAFLPANQRLNLEAGPRGLFLGNRPIEASEDKSFALTLAKARQLEELYVKTLIEIRETGEPELKQGNVGVLADKDTPTGAVLRLAWAPMLVPEEQQSQLNLTSFLIGRRRFDYSNLKVANELQLTPQKDAMALNASYPGGAFGCRMMGFTGERAIELAPAVAFVHIDASGKVVAGTLPAPLPEGVVPEEGAPPAAGPTIGLQTTATDVNWAELSAWATDQKGPIAFAADPNTPWNSFIRVLGPLAFRCKDDKCEKSDPRAQPNIYVGFCE